MPDKLTHSTITQAALMLHGMEFRDNMKLIEDYSSWPDFYFTERRDEVAPYMFFLEGIQFHYPPDTPYAELYRYWDYGKNGVFHGRPFVNENFRHVTEGFAFYIGKTITHWKNQEWEEGSKYLGCLLHMLEDATFGLHTFEGAHGSDPFVLDRMIDAPLQPSAIMLRLKCPQDFPDFGYSWRSLGNSPEEMVMKLYAAYSAYSSDSRKCSFKYIMNTLDDELEKNPALEKRMYSNAVTICADVIGTLLQLSRGEKVKFDAPCSLTELEPYRFPFGGFGAYRFRSFERNRAFDRENKPIDLELDCGKFEKGLSFGTHDEGDLRYWLAPGTFREFRCKAGLHSAFPVTDKLELSLVNDGNVIDLITLDGSRRSTEICIPKPEKEFGLSFHSSHRCGVVVLGEPELSYY